MRVLSAMLAAMLALSAESAAQDSTAVRSTTTPVPADSVVPIVRRAQQLINIGSGAQGRALLDSLLDRTEARSQAEAEVLFWRATLAESWDDAQRDYLRLMLEHDRSARAADAMLRLAQGEVTRGDREAAIRFLERLAREAPESPARAEASLWHGRLLMDRGERAAGCSMLRGGRARVRSGQLELENQYSYLLQACAAEESATAPTASAPAASTPAVTETAQGTPPATSTPNNPERPAPAQPRPTTPPSTPPATTRTPSTTTPATAPAPTAPRGGTAWSVQVGAFGTKAEADDFAGEVKELGFDTRVDGTAAPWRVRFGYYATREEATRAMTDYKTRARADAFLAQVTRP